MSDDIHLESHPYRTTVTHPSIHRKEFKVSTASLSPYHHDVTNKWQLIFRNGPVRVIIIITMTNKWQLILSLRDRWLARRVNQDYADKGSVAHRVMVFLYNFIRISDMVIAMMMIVMVILGKNMLMMITILMIMVINGFG